MIRTQQQTPETLGPVMVTGGTGYLGGEIAQRLLNNGREVIIPTRSASNVADIESSGATAIVGNINSPNDAILEALDRTSTVIHAAGVNGFGYHLKREQWETHVEGTARLMEDISLCGVGKVVMISSAITSYPPDIGQTFYERTKRMAENIALKEQERKNNFDLTIVSPATVQGRRLGGTAKMLLKFLNGEPQTLPDAEISMVFIDDCVDAITNAEAMGRNRSNYVVSGFTTTISELMQTAQELAGTEGGKIKFENRSIPLLGAAALKEAIGAITRNRPGFNLGLAKTMLRGAKYDGTTAANELNFQYSSMPETLEKIIRWYVQEGLVTASLPNFK